jgi:hypothetical protein
LSVAIIRLGDPYMKRGEYEKAQAVEPFQDPEVSNGLAAGADWI